MSDPLTLVYKELSKQLQEFKPVKDIVADKNLILWDRRTIRKGDKVTEAAVPEVELVITSLTPNFGGTSCSSTLDVTFEIITLTNDRKITSRFLPLMWALFGFSHVAKGSAFRNLLFEGKKFVSQIRVPTLATGKADEAERGITGWSAVWAIEMKLTFSEQKLRDIFHG